LGPLGQRFLVKIGKKVGVFEVANCPKPCPVNHFIDEEKREEKDRLCNLVSTYGSFREWQKKKAGSLPRDKPQEDLLTAMPEV
jgi:hypothetical protein